MGDAQKALDDLTHRLPTRHDLDAWTKEAENDGSHRGAAILYATMVENSLETALIQKLNIDDKRKREMFGISGVLGTFYAKIVTAHSVGIFGSQTRKNLDILRYIRNTCAHAKVPISFNTKEIADMISLLTVPAALTLNKGMFADQPFGYDPTGRERYQVACNTIGHNLLLWNMSMHAAVADAKKGIMAPSGCEIVPILQPLP
jgi:hypothetical protein